MFVFTLFWLFFSYNDEQSQTNHPTVTGDNPDYFESESNIKGKLIDSFGFNLVIIH